MAGFLMRYSNILMNWKCGFAEAQVNNILSLIQALLD